MNRLKDGSHYQEEMTIAPANEGVVAPKASKSVLQKGRSELQRKSQKREK